MEAWKDWWGKSCQVVGCRRSTTMCAHYLHTLKSVCCQYDVQSDSKFIGFEASGWLNFYCQPRLVEMLPGDSNINTRKKSKQTKNDDDNNNIRCRFQFVCHVLPLHWIPNLNLIHSSQFVSINGLLLQTRARARRQQTATTPTFSAIYLIFVHFCHQ